MAAYYRSAEVRSRIAEYCGGAPEAPESFSAWQIAGYGGRRRLEQPDGAPVAASKSEFIPLLNEGADLCRSLADHQGAFLHLDIDYVNPEDPAEPYRNPELSFARLEPVYQAARQLFGAHGIRPLALMTGRGYHLSARVPLGSPFYNALVEIGSLGEPLRAKYASQQDVEAAALWGRAHEGAGRLLEHLVHLILKLLKGRTEIPLSLAEVPFPEGGAFICLDLSAYGDPLFERYARCAFSSNQKSHLRGSAPERSYAICLPRGKRSLRTLLAARQDLRQAARLASEVSAQIPDVPGEDLRWLESYRRSRLAGFHREFDEGRHDDPADWARTYDSLKLGALPACVRLPLEFPNPALLSPVYLRTVALALWGMGWHPRAVAGLIRSKYERDFGWGSYWYRYDAAARADFYVRLFCGARADGLEEGRSFTCASQKLRGVCSFPGCGYDLGHLVEALGPSKSRPS